jgi:bifunctional non-homologous end joining protein LigD
MMRRCEWIDPVFVCQVKFAEWTRDGKLRQPVFLGLREDKKPTEVVRESVSSRG